MFIVSKSNIINERFKQKIGEKSINNNGNTMEIISYNCNRDITIKFGDGSTTNTTYGNFKTGQVKSLYDRTIGGVGYTGEGKYKTTENNSPTQVYTIWRCMYKRCYNEKMMVRQPTYRDCFVTEDWHCFQTFAQWYNDNYYEIKNERMALDKDILHRGNRIYAPEHCIFVPQHINNLILKREASRGEYPIGVHPTKNNNRFTVCCNNKLSKCVTLGTFDTQEEAFKVYKDYKENLIKEVADEYKPYIPIKLYDALYAYEFKITD